MTKSDPVIVEIFGEAGDLAIPPAVVKYNVTGVSESTVERRIPVLVEHDLLQKVDDRKGYYEITDKGRAYLAGELDVDDLEDPDDDE